MKKRLVALGMAFLMAMSTCMTAFAGKETDSNGRWAREDKGWVYYNDDGYWVRNSAKKSGDFYWWLGPDGYLKTGHEGEKVRIGNAFFALMENGAINRFGEDASGKKVDLFELMNDQGTGGQEIPQKFGTWDIYETVKNGNVYKAWCYWDEDGSRLEGLQGIQGFKYYFDKDNEIKLGKRGTIVDKHYIMGDYSAAIDRWIPRDGKWA